jgi:small-conductance mechanosensitive channel
MRSEIVLFGMAVMIGLVSLMPAVQRIRWQIRWSGLLFGLCALAAAADTGLTSIDRLPPKEMQNLKTVVVVALWFAVALLSTAALKFAMRKLFPDETQPRTRKLFVDLLGGLIYVVAGIGILNAIFGPPLTGLLATSGVVAVVVGLALQSTLSDLFSGIALNIERPVRAGDWVSLAGVGEGQVFEINWRATRLKTRNGDLVVVPNSVVAKTTLTNHYWPSPLYLVAIPVTFEHAADPAQCKEALLAAAQTVSLALSRPAPSVTVLSIGLSGIAYELDFYVADYLNAVEAKSEALAAVWAEAKSRGLALASERQVVVVADAEKPEARA